ncbi:MAG: phosphomannomutase, partial [Fimbriimonadaceae bacterium]
FPGGAVDRTDGLSMEFADWRFNLRASNTEPVTRLNVESRGDIGLVEQKVAEIEAVLRT